MANPNPLESLSAEDRQKLNLGNLVAQMMQDPQLGAATKRLLKQKQPTLSFPELDAEEAISKAKEESAAALQKMRDEIDRNKAMAALQGEDKRIEEANLDPKAVREFMTKHGVTNVDVVIELMQSRQVLSEPTTPQFQPLNVPNLKEMWADPVKWREKEGYNVLNELRGSQRGTIRQVQ